MPGTMLAGENAACSTSARSFSGFRLSSKYPTSISGKLPFGQTLVRSKGLNGNAFTCASVITWMNRVQRGKSPPSIFSNKSLMAFTILADEGLGFRVRQILDALLGTEVEFDPDALVCGIEEAVRVAAG